MTTDVPRAHLRDLLQRSRPLPALILAAAVGGVLVVALAGVFARAVGVSNETLTREPQVVLEGPAYVGALSNLGVLAFAVGAAVAGLAATLVVGRRRTMFASAAVLTAAMLADDLFLLHDVVYPRLGIPEVVVQVGYLAAIAAIVALARAELGPVAVVGIGLTLACWAISVGMDTVLNNHPLNLDQLVEDGAKFVGILVWSAVWTGVAHRVLRSSPHLAA